MKTTPDSISPQIGLADAPVALWNVVTVAAFLQTAGIPSSEPTIRRNVAAGIFPQPLRFGSKCTRWRADEVRSWVATAGRITA